MFEDACGQIYVCGSWPVKLLACFGSIIHCIRHVKIAVLHSIALKRMSLEYINLFVW